MLEALLKRVNGLEKRLKDENISTSSLPDDDDNDNAAGQAVSEQTDDRTASGTSQAGGARDQPPSCRSTAHETTRPNAEAPVRDSMLYLDAVLEAYFVRLHGKPYFILDESATRQRLRDGMLPRFLVNAIYAVAVRHTSHLFGGLAAASRCSLEYAHQARAEIDVDEPSIEHLQALLLLVMTFFQAGKGKKTYMLLTHAVSMAFALSLHLELPPQLRIAPAEREGRRKLFWTCYLMDRFTISGSKRPALISDDSICLRLPAWLSPQSNVSVDGSYFPNGSSLQHSQGISSVGQGSGAMLVEIVRILGITNRYLTSGGVKCDSHFPWHAQSTLSRIRSDLDFWAADTHDSFNSIDVLFGQPDTTTLVLAKLIYHLIFCLIYRPFLPVDLAELSGTGQHQSWQIEATNLCFLHANAIAELVELGKNTSVIDWPSFVGYCICTAGTVHVHGAHYLSYRQGDLFSSSAEFLTHELGQLSELRYLWGGIQHQRETLQAVYASHSELVKSLATNPMRFWPQFQMEDFFERYPGSYIDGAHVTFGDVVIDELMGPQYEGHGSVDGWAEQHAQLTRSHSNPMVPSQYMTQNHLPTVVRKPKRRRTTAASMPYPPQTRIGPQSAGEAFADLAQHQPQSSTTQQQPAFHSPPHDNAGQNEQQHANGQAHPHTEPLLHTATFTQSALSPSFSFSPLPQNAIHVQPQANAHGVNHAPNIHLPSDGFTAEAPLYAGFDYHTPASGYSQGVESSHTEPGTDRDPFLSLLEQLARDNGSLAAGVEGGEGLGFTLEGGHGC